MPVALLDGDVLENKRSHGRASLIADLDGHRLGLEQPAIHQHKLNRLVGCSTASNDAQSYFMAPNPPSTACTCPCTASMRQACLQVAPETKQRIPTIPCFKARMKGVSDTGHPDSKDKIDQER